MSLHWFRRDKNGIAESVSTYIWGYDRFSREGFSKKGQQTTYSPFLPIIDACNTNRAGNQRNLVSFSGWVGVISNHHAFL